MDGSPLAALAFAKILKAAGINLEDIGQTVLNFTDNARQEIETIRLRIEAIENAQRRIEQKLDAIISVAEINPVTPLELQDERNSGGNSDRGNADGHGNRARLTLAGGH